MTLLLIFLVLASAIILFLWGLTVFMQGWLYQDLTDAIPIRAAASGVVVALFLTIWVFIDTKNPGKYDTLFEFSNMEITDYDSFESVLKTGKPDPNKPGAFVFDPNGAEKITVFKKRTGGKGSTDDFVDNKGKTWKKSTSDAVVAAIIIKEKDGKEVRFKANLDAKGNLPKELVYTDDSKRYMDAGTLGRVYRKKTGVLFANIFLNALHFVVWWMALWLGMRFAIWHAFGFAVVLWLFFMVVIQPVLFAQTRPKDGTAASRESIRWVANFQPSRSL